MARKLSRRSVARYVARRLEAGDDSKSLAKLVAAFLIDTRRTHELDSLIEDISVALAEAGHVNGVVTVTHALSDSITEELKQFTKHVTKASDVLLTTEVDPAVLGGFRLSLPGGEFDATIKHQLMTLKTRYKKA